MRDASARTPSAIKREAEQTRERQVSPRSPLLLHILAGKAIRTDTYHQNRQGQQ